MITIKVKMFCYNKINDSVEKELNTFIQQHDVIDIKQSMQASNMSEINGALFVLFTVMYND